MIRKSQIFFRTHGPGRRFRFEQLSAQSQRQIPRAVKVIGNKIRTGKDISHQVFRREFYKPRFFLLQLRIKKIKRKLTPQNIWFVIFKPLQNKGRKGFNAIDSRISIKLPHDLIADLKNIILRFDLYDQRHFSADQIQNILKTGNGFFR